MGVRHEAGFTLIEVLIVVAIVALITATAGTFFLAGASPAVAAAGRDVAAALDETRRTATAYDVASLVFEPGAGGSGYSARVYAGKPGDAAFRARTGPAYQSSVAIAETEAPLGGPGFAFSIDRRGAVTSFANFVPSAGTFQRLPCPASGRFALRLSYERDVRIVPIACAFAQSDATPIALATAALAQAPPLPANTACPSGSSCVFAPLPGVSPVACPPNTAPDALASDVCVDVVVRPVPTPVPTPVPVATPTPCPRTFSGSAPACSGRIIEQYGVNADASGVHTTTLFANGSICDDLGCSLFGAVDWTWGCAFAERGGTAGVLAFSAPYLKSNAYAASVTQMIALAQHDAAQTSSTGIVSENDSYCSGAGVPAP